MPNSYKTIFLKVVVERDFIYPVINNQTYDKLLANSCDTTIPHISLILTSRISTPSRKTPKQSSTYTETAITSLAHSYEIILIGLVILHYIAIYIATIIAFKKLRRLPSK